MSWMSPMNQSSWRWGALCLAVLGFGPPVASRAAGVPARVELRSLPGPEGRPIELQPPKGGVTVFVFYSSECPISNAYSPTLNQLVTEFPARSLRLVGLCVDPDLTDRDVAAHARDFGFKFPVARDRNLALATKIGARITPEAFVIDDQGKIRYHGRIDDQFAARQKRNANPRTSDLRDAVAAVLAGRAVTAEFVEAVGCPIPDPPRDLAAPTYHRDVLPILQKNCLECHRTGQVGPFPLETYEHARKRAEDIATVVQDRKMPPWKPDPHVGPRFKNDRSLPGPAINTILAWADAGAPEGNPAEAPPPVTFRDDWTLGTPDLVLEMPEAFPVPASGEDIYRCFVVPTHLPEDVAISAIEYRPGNHRIVHHILTYVDRSGQARKRDAADPGPGYTCFSGPGIEIHGDLGGWAPGNEPSRLPDGVGRTLPSQADVVVQVHYHPNGKPETDRSRIGLHFSKKPIRQALHWSAAANFQFQLPPGKTEIEVRGEWPVPVDVEALAVTPHMHLLGRDIHMSVKFPDGRVEDLIKIADWDFNWQNTYYFEKPVALPKGTVLKVVSHFDNSAGNPRNPNHPPKPVRFGEATTDEMCIGFIAITKKGQDLTLPGARDDLRTILDTQRRDFQKQMERNGRERAEPRKAE